MTFKVTVQPSGHTFQAEANEPVLEAGLRQGVALPYGCRGGACGACAVTILSGQVAYPNGEPSALSPAEQANGKALLCLACAQSDLAIDAPQVGLEPDIEIKVLPVRVEKMRKLATDVMELTLKLPASERMRFLAGQYVDILLRDGKRRGFSLANAPMNDQFLELHVRHVPGGHFTGHVFNEMKEKALLRIEGPLGSFYLRESERPLILMGGGTGFAPLKAMLEQMMAQGMDKPVHLYWGVRAKADLYMDGLAQQWAAQQPQLTYTQVLSEPKAEDAWQGRTGWVHAAVAADFPDLSGFDVYLSGPPPMVQAAKTAFLAQGLPEAQLFYDSFEYSPDTLKAMQADAS
ncbi:CDP-6-deoxy-delta-3,4-glucoseen reductase [Candidatus Thiothrix sp. Deng01]|uniref:CDP-6-deoxy-delta-3,4-glucoseen reductase n=1 Tax=Candidatus Thiothrix phosphatis TaxID=3112415 RepID=A0ABU6CUJ3_9GAMM|nr:CDP-6-deoxy-delta-3,4-glucoseen reductase [Candidatus Thiothrix sp. Deng01]MEB4589747.1 CDP-6-deoxy-delta-3,4-glucoseen reductase [Candidatus Thiothrix sp. Deng01]